MPVVHKWDNEEQTIYTFIMRGSWEWSDYQEALRAGYEQIKSVPHEVDVIYAHISALPEGDAVQYLMLASETQPENCNRSVMVDAGRDILEMIVSAIDGMREWEGPKFVDTIDEAREHLAKTE